MRRGAERKMNEKGNGIEKKKQEKSNGEEWERESAKRAMHLHRHRHHIHHLANENSLFHLAKRGLAFPVIQNITTVLDTERKTFLWPKLPD